MSTPEHSDKKQRMGESSQGAAPVHHLRPGMTLVKDFLKRKEQIEIVQICRHLGVGPGGFHQPEYKNGAKLKLWMMCLGKNWDPVSCSYGATRLFDGAPAPAIPEKFIKTAQSAITMVGGVPLINPDICIVNFYNDTGRLGLHQDKDESRSSIEQGLPVDSMSIGDTAEFMFGDTRDQSKASKVNLDSGDVLVLGGESKLLFHGISHVKPHTAPAWLKEDTGLHPGHLNLTFRQY